MKLCFATLGCPTWSLARIAERAALYGYDGVELRIGGDKHIDPAMSAEERAGVKRLFAEAGLAIASTSGYTRFAGQTNPALEGQRDDLIRNIGLASDIGSPYVRTFMGEEDGGRLSEYGARMLREACERAREQGVTVLMETHDSLGDGKQALDLLNTVGSGGLGVLWDIHRTAMAGETPAQTYAALGANIRHLHVKDADAEHRPCLPGEGILPIMEVSRLLEERGFDGYLSFEWEKMWAPELEEPEEAFPRYIALLRSL